MKLVVDANILFAAIIRNGTTHRLLFDLNHQLYAPEFILTEFASHKNELATKLKGSGRTPEEIVAPLLRLITLIPDDELKPYIHAAATLTMDEKDWLYLAAALKENADLWTNDKQLARQKRVKTHTTEELRKR